MSKLGSTDPRGAEASTDHRWIRTDHGELRRAEFAVGAFGLTTFLLALVFVVDALHFHGDALVVAVEALPRGEVHVRGTLLIAVALFDLFALARAVGSVWRGVAAHRRVAARVPLVEVREIAGRRVHVVATERVTAFCAGLMRPRIYVSAGALERLDPAALAAVVAHEAHHAARRDPLRILLVRAIGDAYSFGALSRREQALTELSADAAAVRTGGAAPLAAALLAFHADSAGIAPARVDRLAGRPPKDEVPRALVWVTGGVIGVLLVLLAVGVAMPGHPRFCLPLASAPAWWLCAVTARFAALTPAWIGWRRAGAFLA